MRKRIIHRSAARSVQPPKPIGPPQSALEQRGAAAGSLAIGEARASADADQRIFFYSDGTCSDAQVQLANEYGSTITLSLRGLTGVVTVRESVSTEAAAP